MLGKLFKYEIKATARVFLPLYLLLIVFAIINSFIPLNEHTITMPQVIIITLYIIVFVGMFIVSFVVMMDRFNKNLLSHEGYLMFTLPVETWKHTACKALVNLMWVSISLIMAFISIVIIALQASSLKDIFSVFTFIWGVTKQLFGANAYQLILQIIVGVIVWILNGILMIYLSIAIGHLSNNHKNIVSTGAFLLIYALFSIISNKLFAGILSPALNVQQMASGRLANYPFGPIWLMLAISALYGAIYFIVTNLLLSKRLNLK